MINRDTTYLTSSTLPSPAVWRKTMVHTTVTGGASSLAPYIEQRHSCQGTLLRRGRREMMCMLCCWNSCAMAG